ncbi:hypothetical protein N9V69_03915 [Candidatus Pelagibacter bacterium]|nr:hypothetical protein [Candidatus Pelagibacter bacterium]
MNYLKISIGIFTLLAASRFVPHPPNFTPLIALSFYLPILAGKRYIPILISGFILTDLIIGIHDTIFFTWGSLLTIGLLSINFKKNLFSRISGSLSGAIIFFIITNFGVWSLGSYSYTAEGLILSYYLAIPFFTNTLISTLIYSILIEILFNKKIISYIR